jgi:hypothetical protein
VRLTTTFLGLFVLVQQSAIRVDVNLQQVRFTMKDCANQAVTTLTPADVIVEENGVRQSAVSVKQ